MDSSKFIKRLDTFAKGFDDMRKLEDDWDSYGAKAPSEKLIKYCERLAIEKLDVTGTAPSSHGIHLYSEDGFEIIIYENGEG